MDHEPTNTLPVISYNIRFDNSDDGPNAWPHRKENVARLLRRHRPALAGLQEALRHQIDDLAQRLPGYGWIGAGRQDGRDAGEFTPIFYDQSRLTLLQFDVFWLSETPHRPGSRDWDADCIRIVTWAQFAEKRTPARFFLFNTHFDHFSETARVQSAYLLLEKIAEIAPQAPAIVTGDFNCPPRSEPYQILTQGGGSPRAALRDARRHARQGHHGPTGTLNPDFSGLLDQKIDYIFVTPHLRVLRHAILPDKFEGNYPSDHLPLLAHLALP